MPRTTGSATPTTLAPRATTPRGSASSCSPTTKRTPRARRNRRRRGSPGPGTGPHQGAGPSAPPPSPPRGANINAQLVQARELEAKLAEEYRAVRLLCASIAWEASARGERACELGKQARERINADFDVDNPSTPPASEPESHPCRDTAAGHACSLNARGAEPAPGGADAHRASGHVAGRELSVPHPPAGERAGRRGCARP
jgi:hypothetical protein